MTEKDVPVPKPAVVERASGIDFGKADEIRCELGLHGLRITLSPDFDDSAFSRQLLGLEVSWLF